ncbi:homeobox protein 5 isoform X2 [Drosophila grimshawi]|nr:homeobox protein 5 isoform X2 [Drosophila grimshawi]
MPFLAQFMSCAASKRYADRGQRSGTPRSNNCTYEGDIVSPMQLVESSKWQPQMAYNCNNNHNMDQQMMPMRRLHTEEEPVLQQCSSYNSNYINNNNNYNNQNNNNNNNYSYSNSNKNRSNYQSDTDSELETEYRKNSHTSESCIFPKDSRCRRGIEYLKSTMQPQRQMLMEAAMQRFCENTFLNRMLLLLQLFGILATGAIVHGVRLGINLTQRSFRLLHCKFKLRSLLRKLLWSLAGAKGDDALLFLGVLIISPWLFLIGLVGFIISSVLHFKEVLGTIMLNYVFK